MKKIFAILIGIIAVAAVSFMFFSNRHSPALRSAHQSELSGEPEQALALYCEALANAAPSVTVPDINRSKILPEDKLKKETAKYFSAITASGKKIRPDVASALEGIKRCENRVQEHVNTLSQPKVQPLDIDGYISEWNRSFFAPTVEPARSHESMATGNFTRAMSLLVISSGKDYTYELCLLNLSNLRGTRCTLLSENSVRLYAEPGEYLLLCRSSVTFPTGEIWRSGWTPIKLEMPLKASLVTADMRTSIQRKSR